MGEDKTEAEGVPWLKGCEVCTAGLCGRMEELRASGLSERKAAKRMEEEAAQAIGEPVWSAEQIRRRYLYHTGKDRSGTKRTTQEADAELEKEYQEARTEAQILKHFIKYELKNLQGEEGIKILSHVPKRAEAVQQTFAEYQLEMERRLGQCLIELQAHLADWPIQREWEEFYGYIEGTISRFPSEQSFLACVDKYSDLKKLHSQKEWGELYGFAEETISEFPDKQDFLSFVDKKAIAKAYHIEA